MEAYDGFVGELNAEVISKVYKGLSGIVNTSYTMNIVEADKWWTKKYFSYMNEPPMTSADIHNIQFDTTVVSLYSYIDVSYKQFKSITTIRVAQSYCSTKVVLFINR